VQKAFNPANQGQQTLNRDDDDDDDVLCILLLELCSSSV